jgi:hypothetical protein
MVNVCEFLPPARSVPVNVSVILDADGVVMLPQPTNRKLRSATPVI